jgi:hypothetical protein
VGRLLPVDELDFGLGPMELFLTLKEFLKYSYFNAPQVTREHFLIREREER